MALGVETFEPVIPFPICRLLFGLEEMSSTSDGWRNKKLCFGAERDPVLLHDKSFVEAVTFHETNETTRVSISKLESLPMRLLEEISQRLDDEDLSRLCQVNKYCHAVFCQDDFWQWRAERKGIVKARLARNWKWNMMAAYRQIVTIRRLSERSMKFVGDLTFIDPFKVFFTGSGCAAQLEVLKHLLRPFVDCSMDCVVTYRGVSAAFITSIYWDSDMAFEISRKGVSVGIDSSRSRVIAVIPKKLIDILREENGTDFEGGVTVESVNGELRTNNGDFIVLDPAACPTLRDLARLTYDDQLQCADVLCAAGGSWTFTDDSSDEEDDDISEYSADSAQEDDDLSEYSPGSAQFLCEGEEASSCLDACNYEQV